MPAPFQSLRKWFAIAAAALLVIVAGFFIDARWSARHIQERAKDKLGIEVKSSTSGFTLSKSEAGRTLFTVQAAKAVEYKEGGR
jgi:lipopolysaccharide export system protein LptA